MPVRTTLDRCDSDRRERRTNPDGTPRVDTWICDRDAGHALPHGSRSGKRTWWEYHSYQNYNPPETGQQTLPW